ncbi:hypothetical protein TCAL_06056 [Tigriopus californicus]|uniref:Mannosyltransferase n=1 Tax=Tigriopus californicus TaxID=6832 RepID=A0A553PNQ5_TIGCA|nr:alpha-1,2-mannosyltransferase ALG9-like [Tigriopus californicus]TRY79306.1 hypothetical protein TCAL_06056 [Tigriopus californicus]|eukprot:TCALIF_06056-PA protein Name:"Similar to Alg9 Alpha-1,2-mannosyltransferase ALG9 (Mus musculus)" AED:0.00 eAED:0.00 QI:172/1/0.5/1/1/1/2/0/598
MGVPADARHSRRARQPAPSARGSDPRRKRDQAARSASVNSAYTAVEPGPWCPRSYTAFKILLIVRLSSGLWSHIGDCDETYNYWEPLHFFLYGRGFQTWEHSPEYALRSYTYILLHLVPAWLYDKLLNPPPVYVFFFVRCILALVCTGAEVYWIRGIRQQIGPNVARLTLAILVGSAGMFVAGCALLPASTSMWLSMVAMGAWAQGHYPLAIFCTAGSTFLSWPFAAILGLPIALDVLVRRRRWSLFVVWSAISTVVLLVPQIWLDSAYYGRSVVAPWNIISYNIFTSHGPDLYGVADLRFYLINASLNFNIAFPLSLVSGPCLLLTYGWANKNSPSTNLASRLLQLMGFYVWILIFFYQPHKEERFLYPIYPLIAFGAATTIDCLEKVAGQWVFNVKKGHYTDHTSHGSAFMVICIMLLGLSRSVALYKNYGGSFNAWLQISHLPFEAPDVEESMTTYTQVCVGKEWHRFPSSFFLPSQHWAMRFIRSEFRGQLPATYSSHVNGTYETRNIFNDLNQEEMDRYTNIEDCDYLVDLDNEKESEFEPNYSQFPDWTVVHSFPFIDNEKSNGLFKAFYVPILSEQVTFYHNYNILKRNKG